MPFSTIPLPSSTSFAHFHGFIRWLKHQRICLQYPDMAIHASGRALSELYGSTVHNQPVVICTNVNVKHHIHLGADALRVLKTPNAGNASSQLSEALSAELLRRFLNVDQVKTETELVYHSPGPITDYACRWTKDIMLGVSVTRAMAYGRQYTKDDAASLLTRKLNAIQHSAKSVLNTTFDRQLLHVFAETGKEAGIVMRACKQLSRDIKASTIVLVTTINDDTVFSNKKQTVFFNSNRHLLSAERHPKGQGTVIL